MPLYSKSGYVSTSNYWPLAVTSQLQLLSAMLEGKVKVWNTEMSTNVKRATRKGFLPDYYSILAIIFNIIHVFFSKTFFVLFCFPSNMAAKYAVPHVWRHAKVVYWWLVCTGMSKWYEIARFCYQTQGLHVLWTFNSLWWMCLDWELTPAEIYDVTWNPWTAGESVRASGLCKYWNDKSGQKTHVWVKLRRRKLTFYNYKCRKQFLYHFSKLSSRFQKVISS